MPSLHARSLFASPLVAVSDVRCRAPRGDRSDEERARAHQLIFTRGGAFLRHEATRGGRASTPVVAEPAQVLLFNADEPYRVSHPLAGGDDCTVVAFAADVAVEVAAACDPSAADRPGSPFARTHAAAAPSALLRQHRLRRRAAAPDAQGLLAALAVEEEALTLLHQVVRSSSTAAHLPARAPRRSTVEARRERAEATRLRLAARPNETPSLSQLAREVHSSPFHLARLFRAEVGVPIHQYLLRLRLALALDRLHDGAPSLSALALDLGFSSHAHFTDAFRRAFGLAPSAARQATEASGREVRTILEAAAGRRA